MIAVFQQIYTKLSEKERKILTVAVLFLILAFVDRLFLSPTSERLKTLDQNIKEEENDIKKDLHFLSYKAKILKESETLRPYFSQKEKTEEEIIASFLKKIEILATQANVNLVKVSPSEAKDKKGYKEYSANLECSGTLPNIVMFLHLVDSSPDLLKTTKLNMSVKKAGAEDLLSTMTVTKIIMDPAGNAADVTIIPPESGREIHANAPVKRTETIVRDDTDDAQHNEVKITHVKFSTE